VCSSDSPSNRILWLCSAFLITTPRLSYYFIAAAVLARRLAVLCVSSGWAIAVDGSRSPLNANGRSDIMGLPRLYLCAAPPKSVIVVFTFAICRTTKHCT
jgi:hypothetical protein